MADVEEIVNILAGLKGKKASVNFETPYHPLNSTVRRTS